MICRAVSHLLMIVGLLAFALVLGCAPQVPEFFDDSDAVVDLFTPCFTQPPFSWGCAGEVVAFVRRHLGSHIVEVVVSEVDGPGEDHEHELSICDDKDVVG